MGKKSTIALVGLIVEDQSLSKKVNDVLHDYGKYIIGRMGLPYKERKVNVISVVLDAPEKEIAELSSKLGKIKGVKTNTVLY